MVCNGFLPEIDVYDHQTMLRKSHLGKVKLNALDYISNRNSCVFGGMNDDLVIAGSGGGDTNVYIWSIPEFMDQDLKVNQPLCILPGHEQTIINCVRYSNEGFAIITAYENGNIKLWTLQTSPFIHND